MKKRPQKAQDLPAIMPIELRLEALADNPRNPRTVWREEELGDLQASIEQHGVLQPIVVRRVAIDPERYEVVCGARRVAAVRALGRESIPAIVRELDEREADVLSLVENLQRVDLTPLEEAHALEALVAQRWTLEEVALHCGRSKRYVTQRLRLMTLPGEVLELLRLGHLDAPRALLLSTIQDPEQMWQAACEITGHPPKWTVAEAQQEPPRPDAWMRLGAARLAIARRFQAVLRLAEFPLDDETLVPAAGSCIACPKHTHAMASLFLDEPPAESQCTDRECFAAKCEAQFARRAAEIRKRKGVVLEGDAAVRAWHSEEYVSLDDSAEEFGVIVEVGDDEDAPTLRDVLGKSVAKRITPVLMREGPHRRPQELVACSDVRAALEKAGVRLVRSQPVIPEQSDEEPADVSGGDSAAQPIVDANECRRRFLKRLDGLPQLHDAECWTKVVMLELIEQDFSFGEEVLRQLGVDQDLIDSSSGADDLIPELGRASAAECLAALRRVWGRSVVSQTQLRWAAALAEPAVDLAEIERQVREEVQAEAAVGQSGGAS